MLDTKDIELLQNIIVTTMNQQFSEQDKKWETILDQRFTLQDERWETILDQRFAQQNERWETILDQRFALQDKRWETILDQRFALQNERWETILDQRFTQQNESWETILDQRFAESENLVLEELDRVETRLTRRMDKMQDNLDDLNRLCRILLLEKGNYELLERRVATLESRVYPQ
ncbi:MAG: hypothetical protein MR922_01305 [Lachnospiraceae bacterium]|nr:hypothetical protein [Lachnospiraceae bacterium]